MTTATKKPRARKSREKQEPVVPRTVALGDRSDQADQPVERTISTRAGAVILYACEAAGLWWSDYATAWTIEHDGQRLPDRPRGDRPRWSKRFGRAIDALADAAYQADDDLCRLGADAQLSDALFGAIAEMRSEVRKDGQRLRGSNGQPADAQRTAARFSSAMPPFNEAAESLGDSSPGLGEPGPRGKRSRRKPAGEPANGRPAADVSAEAASGDGRPRTIPLEQLINHPDNPDPTEAEVLRMMEWLTADGQKEPIHVRALVGDDLSPVYEILAGKTRFAAARRLGWPSLRAEVHDELGDPLRAAVFAARSNLERRREGPVRQAAWAAALIERRVRFRCEGREVKEQDRAAAGKWTAEQLGLSVEGLRNKLRFAKLPEPWRSRVAPGPDGDPELSERVARALLPYAHVPQILTAADKNYRLKPDAWERWKWFSVEDVARALRHLVRQTTGPIDGKRDYGYELEYEHPCYFKLEELDEATRAKLQIVELPGDERGKTQQVALNLKEYERLNLPLVKQAVAKRKAAAAKKARGRDTAKPERKSPKELQRDRQRKAELLAERIAAWRHDWLRGVIAKRAEEGDSQLQAFGTWVTLANLDHHASYSERKPSALFADAATGLGHKLRKATGGADRRELWDQVTACRGRALYGSPQRYRELERVTTEFYRRLLTRLDRDYRFPLIPHQVVIDLAADYGLDLEAEWYQLQRGEDGKRPGWDAFLGLFQRAQLAELAQEWGLCIPDTATRTGIVNLLGMKQKAFPLPKCLRKGTEQGKAK